MKSTSTIIEKTCKYGREALIKGMLGTAGCSHLMNGYSLKDGFPILSYTQLKHDYLYFIVFLAYLRDHFREAMLPANESRDSIFEKINILIAVTRFVVAMLGLMNKSNYFQNDIISLQSMKTRGVKLAGHLINAFPKMVCSVLCFVFCVLCFVFCVCVLNIGLCAQ